MKLFEFEGKAILEESGINVPKCKIAYNLEEVSSAVDEIGYPAILKAQVLSGSRGKRGGIKVVKSNEEALKIADIYFNKGLKEEKVTSILIEEAVEFIREFYISITADALEGSPVLMMSAAGGVDIENVPDVQISRVNINIIHGIRNYHCRKASAPWRINKLQFKDVVSIIQKLYQIYRQYDADLVEINPLALTSSGVFVALDAKIIINDNALFRQVRFEKSRDRYDNELEYRASQNNLNYVKLNGNIGLLCTGAGLTLATLDLIKDFGGSAANFMESGGANYANTYRGLQLVLSDPDVKVLLINTFGLVSRADVICRGLVDGLKELKSDIPVVACIRGTGEDKARRMFRQEYDIEPFDHMESAIKEAIRLARCS